MVQWASTRRRVSTLPLKDIGVASSRESAIERSRQLVLAGLKAGKGRVAAYGMDLRGRW